MDPNNENGSASLPPLSLSILGIEPIDEFIREVADFIHHMISQRSQDALRGQVEVEAKIGVLKDRSTGARLTLPVLTETSECIVWHTTRADFIPSIGSLF